jgi:hypothetical protein
MMAQKETRKTAQRQRLLVGVLLLLLSLNGCGSDDPAVVGEGAPSDGASLTLVSDDSRAVVKPLCVGHIPPDLTTCPDAPANLGLVELDQTRKATLVVPAEVATGGYRVRLNGVAAEGLAEVVNEQSLQLRIPADAVAAPGETVLTVESLLSPQHYKAVWQFLLSDPAGVQE